jgi:acyl-lipid omega-6 desaturase (Delta-12 desaturase)
MQTEPMVPRTLPAPTTLRAATAPYQHADIHRSLWQVATTFIPYLLLWYLMERSLAVSYWITLMLAVIAGGFLVRIFIILHDCGHGSFFTSQRFNDILGSICGVFTFTPYFQWRHDHAVHHATAGNLDRRGHGDVHTLTVAEYCQMSRRERLKYRIFRHPLLMLLAGPAWAFVISQRVPLPHSRPRERRSVHATNLALLLVIGALSLLIGFKSYLLIQLPIFLVAATVAVWLFYCQHQFEETYWAHHEEWDYEAVALQGSSYFHLPRVLQWFTGNIGFHHVHHFNPRIPNYYLEASHNAHPRFQKATRLTWRSSWQCFAFKLWDEERQQMVRLREIGQAVARPGRETRAG